MASTASPPAGQAASPGLNGKIAFISNRDGNQEIYVMNADGTSPTRLTFTSANELGACWSPDGTKIALTSERDGNPEIYVMNADGTNPTRLTNNSAFDGVDAQCWSPDGTKITFGSHRDGNPEIYAMNPDGSGQTNLTNISADDIQPSWSADSTKITFASSRDNNSEIYVMNANGTSPTRLTNNSVPDSNPNWSPDGTKIAFSSVRDIPGINQDIFVMNADGANQTNLTNMASADESADWSPDGTKITFASIRDGNFEIYVMNANGSGQTNLTNNSATDTEPAWQPLRDTTPATITLTTPADGATYEHNEVVLAGYACQDEVGGSGLASCVGDVPNGSAIDTSTLGNHSFTVTASDNEGNPASVTHNYSVVDVTAPTITITTPPDGAVYGLIEGVVADYTCQDEAGGSGLASCVGDVPDGSAIDTSTVGGHSFTVNAEDNAGNMSTLTHDYSVVYTFAGFFSPINNEPTVNKAKAGQTIAVKWRLTDNNGVPISDPASFTNLTTGSMTCNSNDPTDAIETYAGSSGLQHLGDGYWQFNWKTPKSYAGECRVMMLNLADGTTHKALFQFT